MEYVEGVLISDLEDTDKGAIKAKTSRHLFGDYERGSSWEDWGPWEVGVGYPTVGALNASEKDFWGLREGEGAEYGFCHNDLSQHNVIVDSRTLKIAAIIDWEYVRFWPEYFEGAFYERPGP